jgi:hypothetical protein
MASSIALNGAASVYGVPEPLTHVVGVKLTPVAAACDTTSFSILLRLVALIAGAELLTQVVGEYGINAYKGNWSLPG